MKRLRRFVLAACVTVGAAELRLPPSALGATCEEILVPLPDGTRLHGWARHGEQAADQRPIVWTMTPYANTGCVNNAPFGMFTPEMVEKVTLVRISYRGTGASEGGQDAWGPGDRQDVVDVGNWLAARPYAAGLFPTGASAEGAWITFALDHPAVKAALWVTSCADGYRGCIRSGGELAGGAFILTAGEVEGYAEGLPDRLRNGTTKPTPAEQLASTAVNGAPAFVEDENGAFWQSRLGLHYLDDVKVPVMFTTDLYDYVPHGMYIAYEHTPASNAWLSTTLGHNAPSAVSSANTALGALARIPIHRFVEKYLFDAGGDDPARVRLMTNLGTVSGYERAEVLVRDEADWPLPSTVWTRLYLDGGKSRSATSLNDGRLALAAGCAENDAAPLASVGPKGELRTQLAIFGAIGSTGQNPAAAAALTSTFLDDLRADETIGLTYTTPPLAEDTEVSGPIVLMVRAIATAPDFDWQVRLTDVHPDGRSSWISDGQLRASLRNVDEEKSVKNADGDYVRPWLSFDRHDPVPVGVRVDYVIELAPTSNVFRAGDRIRVDLQPIAEGYVDSARSAGLGALLVERGGANASRIVLPVVPGRCQLGELASSAVEKPTCGSELRFRDWLIEPEAADELSASIALILRDEVADPLAEGLAWRGRLEDHAAGKIEVRAVVEEVLRTEQCGGTLGEQHLDQGRHF
jgi:uncharacterized protein